jgi:hypothetical protein
MIKPGDQVEIDAHPGWTGTVQFVSGDPSGPRDDDEIWVDCNPGAVGGYRWVLRQVPHGPDPDAVSWYALNVFRRDEVTPITARGSR